MDQSKSYVQTDDQGVMRVGSTRVMVDSVVASYHHGYSSEAIQQQYPALSLEEVYGAIAWYLANTEEAENSLAHQAAIWERERAKAAARLNPVLQRLRAVREQKALVPS